MIDFFASRRHYAAHLAPIWHALPADLRGVFYVGVNVEAVEDLHVPWLRGRPPYQRDWPVVVAAGTDLWATNQRPAVLVEHGAGQAYQGVDLPSYSGGHGRDRVVLFVVPNGEVAARNQARYPAIPNAVVGSPPLDRWAGRPWTRQQPPTVAVSFHWDGAAVCPEARSAFSHFRTALPFLTSSYRLLGHAHPRGQQRVFPTYREYGIETVSRWEDVLDRADMYVCDNSSTIYEFAATGRPVVLLDAPWYRREVEHGLRFWQWADIGPRINDPALLLDAVAEALDDLSPWPERRQTATEAIFGAIDGAASQRAAASILRLSSRE